MMTPNYLVVKMDWTINQVTDHIRSYGTGSETIDVIFAIDDQGKLLDDINIKDLLFVSPHSKIREIADNQFTALSPFDTEEEAQSAFKRDHRIALPVIDDKGVILGIVTIDDILKRAKDDATDTIQKMGGTEALDGPYIKAPKLLF